MSDEDEIDKPVGLILCGGEAKRLGGVDKALLELVGRPLLAWIIETLSLQCRAIMLSANGDAARFAAFGCPVIADDARDRNAGPLAGVLAGLDAVADQWPTTRSLLTVAGDTPFIPRDLVARLRAEDAPVVACQSGHRNHPTSALWAVELGGVLRRQLRDQRHRRVEGVIAGLGVKWVRWPTTPFDPFFNVNTPAELATARRWAGHTNGALL